MTSYHFSIGYNGATHLDRDEAWEILLATARNVADNPRGIEEHAKLLGCPDQCDDGTCKREGYASNYIGEFGSHGHPITIMERGEQQQLIQWASTGCDMKYHIRRSFARLLISAMHRKGIEINMVVG